MIRPIYLKLSEPNTPVPPCASRFWGNPDLPQGFDYPTYTDCNGAIRPYVFICQINLQEVAPYDTENRLPHKGLLAFFAKIECYLGYDDDVTYIGSCISAEDDVRVLYFPDTHSYTFKEAILEDKDGESLAPAGLSIGFTHTIKEEYLDEHALFAPPVHREWETWDPPYEDWQILLQVDSFEGTDFNLNFMDCGVLAFLIAPDDLKAKCFSHVRAIVLSS